MVKRGSRGTSIASRLSSVTPGRIRVAVVSALTQKLRMQSMVSSALAWLGDAVVQEHFRRWDKRTAMRKKLYIRRQNPRRLRDWELTTQEGEIFFTSIAFAISRHRVNPTNSEGDGGNEPACPLVSENCKSNRTRLSDGPVQGPASAAPNCRSGLATLSLLWSRLCTAGARWRAHWLMRISGQSNLPGDLLR